MNPKHKTIVKKFNGDIKVIVITVSLMPFVVDPLVGILNSFEYMLRWGWIMFAISAVFLVMFATSKLI